MLQQPIQIILSIPMVRVFVSILELDYVIIDLTLCFISPHIYSIDNTTRHQEAGEWPMFQDLVGQQKILAVPLKLPVILNVISG